MKYNFTAYTAFLPVNSVSGYYIQSPATRHAMIGSDETFERAYKLNES